uniref:Transcription factor 24 n=1 Tax=Anas platyrhynchos platyrhynchos TaxID=8840 RepID=A0A493TWC5_ANAPP
MSAISHAVIRCINIHASPAPARPALTLLAAHTVLPPHSAPHLAASEETKSSKETSSPSSEPEALPPSVGQRAGAAPGRPAAANAARERSRVQTLRQAFLELQKTLPSVPPDTKLSKLDVLLLATTYIAHLTRSLQDEEEVPGEGLGALRGDGYLHPVKKWPMRSRLYIGATGQFLNHSVQGESGSQGETSTNSQN